MSANPKQKGRAKSKDNSKLFGKVHNADCIDFMMNKVEEKSISVIVTSPPYNLKTQLETG